MKSHDKKRSSPTSQRGESDGQILKTVEMHCTNCGDWIMRKIIQVPGGWKFQPGDERCELCGKQLTSNKFYLLSNDIRCNK